MAKKDKKETKESGESISSVTVPFAKPLADKKLQKKLLKLVKKAASDKEMKRGVREVTKSIRKGQKGLVVIAGDVSPVDVISHVPILCEDSQIPYVFVESKDVLGSVSETKRPTTIVLITPGPKSSQKELYEEILGTVKEITVQ